MLLLIIMAGFRGQIGKDYHMYIEHYNRILTGSNVNVEPSFRMISHFVDHYFGNVTFLFLIYAILGVSLKFIAIKKISEFFLFSVLIYYSHYFLLEEMTQIRVGIAVGFILLSIIYIEERKILLFLLCIGLASIFHYSALTVLPFYFLRKDKIQIWYYFLIPIGYLFYLINFDIVSLVRFVDIDFISAKYEAYKIKGLSDHVNVLNAWQLGRIVFSALLLWKWEYLQSRNKYAVLLIKFYLFACFFLVALASIPAFSFRVSDLFGSAEFLLIPFLFYFFKDQHKLLGEVSIIIIGLIFITVTLFYDGGLLKAYF